MKRCEEVSLALQTHKEITKATMNIKPKGQMRKAIVGLNPRVQIKSIDILREAKPNLRPIGIVRKPRKTLILSSVFAFLVKGSDIALGFVLGLFAFGFFLLILSPRPTRATLQTNTEVWEWVDWRGRQRRIIVHREVKAPGA
jgi:hypothetical protein